MRRRIGHLIVVLIGLVIIVYPLTLARADVSCYDRELRAGQICAKADGSPGQSYEERIGNLRAARPIMIGVGALVAGFGAVLLTTDIRRGRRLSR